MPSARLRQRRLHRGDDAIDVFRQRAAIGVAQHQPARAGVVRGAQAFERIRRDWPCSRRRNARRRTAARGLWLSPPRWTRRCRRHSRCAGFRARHRPGNPTSCRRGRRHRLSHRTCSASPGSLAALRPARLVMPNAVMRACCERKLLGEERRVGRVGARPAAFDVIDAQRIERQRDLPLVLDGEIDALRLRAVAERGVEEKEAFAGHAQRPPTRRGLRRVDLPTRGR